MVLSRIKESLLGAESGFDSVQIDEDLYDEIQSQCAKINDEKGPLLLIRPPRENEGMDASIPIYETLHNPRVQKMGLGRLKFAQTNAHSHSHEIWYHGGQMQFFLHPQTRVDANQVSRQVRSNYPNAEIREVDQKFPSIEPGEYVSVSELRLKRDFYFPVKAKLATEDDFELDPYGDITADMVVEEDKTETGQRVEAKDCKVVVQTVFEPARDVWHQGRPYGVDVSQIAAGMKESEVHGSHLRGWETRSPSKIKRKTAEIVDSLRGSKGYYITMRIVAISPYKEIAERRAYTIAHDYEKYYHSITQQGLTPTELSKSEMKKHVVEVAGREHTLRFRDRFMSNGKFLQPVEALGAMAHIPNEDINTPAVDWATQDTGPGVPAETTQIEEHEREMSEESTSGVQPLNPESGGSAGVAEPTSQTPSPANNNPPTAEADTNGGTPSTTPTDPESNTQPNQPETTEIENTPRSETGQPTDQTSTTPEPPTETTTTPTEIGNTPEDTPDDDSSGWGSNIGAEDSSNDGWDDDGLDWGNNKNSGTTTEHQQTESPSGKSHTTTHDRNSGEEDNTWSSGSDATEYDTDHTTEDSTDESEISWGDSDDYDDTPGRR